MLRPRGTSRPRGGDRDHELVDVVEHNIGSLVEVRRQFNLGRSPQDRLAESITTWSGSMTFIADHAAWFAIGVARNLGWLGSGLGFDSFPFGLLTMIVSPGAIFPSTFVLISQDRQAEAADLRAEPGPWINPTAESELTRLLEPVGTIADHRGPEEGRAPELEELKWDVSPGALTRKMDRLERDWTARPAANDHRCMTGPLRLKTAATSPVPVEADWELIDAEIRRPDAGNIGAAIRWTKGKVYGPNGAAQLLGIKPTTLASRIWDPSPSE